MTLLAVLACSAPPESGPPPRGAVAQAPTVVLDGVETVLVTEPATLFARVDDPDSPALTYVWSLRERPWDSEATIESVDGPQLTFQPDRPGLYAVDLTVSDGTRDVTATAVVHALTTTEPPTAQATADPVVPVGWPARLDGTGSFDDNGLPLLYQWALQARPPSSAAALQQPRLPVATLVPDAPGAYRAELVVHNRGVPSDPVEVELEARPDPIDPGDVAGGRLLPGEVYVVGRLDTCTLGLAHWSDPSTTMGALHSCKGNDAVLSVRMDPEGEVLYVHRDDSGAHTLRRWVCDDCGGPAKGDVHANDEVLATPCPPDAPVTDVLVSPEGRRLTRCGEVWIDDVGRSIDGVSAEEPFAYGNDDIVLTRYGDLLDYAAGTDKEIPDPSVDAARVVPGGFVVLHGNQLSRIDASDGSAKVQGSLRGVVGVSLRGDGALDASYAAFQRPLRRPDEEPFPRQQQFVTQVLYRRRADGVAHPVIDLDRDSAPLMEVRWLVTGP